MARKTKSETSRPRAPTVHPVPVVYRAFFLLVEPISALVGAFFAIAKPERYLHLLLVADPLPEKTYYSGLFLSPRIALAQLGNL